MEDALLALTGIVMLPAMIWFMLVWPFRRDRKIIRGGSKPFLCGSFIIGWFFIFVWVSPLLFVASVNEKMSIGLSGWGLAGEILLWAAVYCAWAFFTLNLNDRRRWAWGGFMVFLGLFSVVSIVGVYQEASAAGNHIVALVIWPLAVVGQVALLTVYIKKRWQELSQEVWLPTRRS